MRHWNNGTDHRHSKSSCDKSSPARRTIKCLSVWYVLWSVWVRLSIFPQLSIILCGAVCFQFTYFPCDDWENIYILCLIIIIKSEVWTITHCLGLGHETVVCAVCLSVFLWHWLQPLQGWRKNIYTGSRLTKIIQFWHDIDKSRLQYSDMNSLPSFKQDLLAYNMTINLFRTGHTFENVVCKMLAILFNMSILPMLVLYLQWAQTWSSLFLQMHWHLWVLGHQQAEC